MSWETASVGSFEFKMDVSDKKKLEVIEKLQLELECDIYLKYGSWSFSDLNWSSHVRSENVLKVFKEHKVLFEEFSFTIYYLNECCPKDNFQYSDGEILVEDIIT